MIQLVAASLWLVTVRQDQHVPISYS